VSVVEPWCDAVPTQNNMVHHLEAPAIDCGGFVVGSAVAAVLWLIRIMMAYTFTPGFQTDVAFTLLLW